MKHYPTPEVVVEPPKNGDLIKCDRCRCAHRLVTAKVKATSQMVPGTLLFNCNGTLRIAARNFILKPEFRIIDLRTEPETEFADLSHKGKRREERRLK